MVDGADGDPGTTWGVPVTAEVAGPRPMRAAAVVLLFGAAAFAGCVLEPDLPPIFAVDEIRYWWEDDFFVVNITIRNTQNFTAGYDAPNPWMRVQVKEFYDTGTFDDGYRIYGWNGTDPWNLFTLYFESRGIAGRDEWQQRYYEEEARIALGRQHDPNYTHANYGPVTFPRNASVSPEIVFKPTYKYSGLEGYYAIEVSILAAYPQEIRETGSGTGWTDYYTGCFNLDTPEFYGVHPETRQGCNYWFCEGDYTSTGGEYPLYLQNGKMKDEFIPECGATEHVGPYYDE